MFDDDLPDIALRGETGIDLFRRLDDEGQRRARFRCLATLDPGGSLILHAPEARPDPARLTALAQALAGDPLTRPLSLTEPASWPTAADGGDPIRLFLYLEFLRAWQVADLAGARLESQLARSGAAALPEEPGRLAGAVAPVFDFNRIARGVRLAQAIVPLLAARIALPGFRDDRHGGTGYALRMLGDLCLRAAEPALALRCFETAVAAGDNPFRRRKAIEAARAAGDAEAAARHRAGYAARWTLPADLTETGDAA
ncbi:MAG: hypothetical protein ACK4GT_07870 [Pararhodobacter sp.]